MTFSVSGKTAIVTGAANGLGLAISRQFLSSGAKVMLADIDAKGLKAEVDGSNDQAWYFTGDLSEKLTRKNLLAATIDRFERVDILINASRRILHFDSDTQSIDDPLDEMLDKNLRLHYHLSRLVADRFKEQSGDDFDPSGPPIGAIVNVISIAARRTRPELLEYSASCAAFEQLTRAQAVTLAADRIRVNAVEFGSVMSTRLRMELANNPELRKNIVNNTPLGRIAEAKEVAYAVEFLASEGAQFITGQVITVDGGRTLLDSVESPHH